MIFDKLASILSQPCERSCDHYDLLEVVNYPPCLVPRPLRWVDGQRRLAEAGVRVVFGNPEGQRVPGTGGHRRGHRRSFGLHGDQGAPGGDGGDVALLWNDRDTKIRRVRWQIVKKKKKKKKQTESDQMQYSWVLFPVWILLAPQSKTESSAVWYLHQLSVFFPPHNSALVPDGCVVIQGDGSVPEHFYKNNEVFTNQLSLLSSNWLRRVKSPCAVNTTNLLICRY